MLLGWHKKPEVIVIPGLKYLSINLGGVLLSHTLKCSTIAAGGLNFRVRDGNGCTPSAITTKKSLL